MTVKKDEKGNTWLFIIELPRDPVTNKRRQRKRRGFKTKKEAQAAENAEMNEVYRGTYIEETDMTFESFCELWINDYASSVKISTVRVRKHQMGHLLNQFKRIKIKDISKQMYQTAINNCKKLGLMDNTISGIHGAGRMIFARAMELDMVKVDPTQYTRLPRTKMTVEDIENEVELPKYLEKDELAIFLKTAAEKGLEGDYEYFLTLAYTGMRVGEMVPLKDTDLNMSDCTISITKTYYNPNNNAVQYVLLPPKTKKSKRVIEIEPLLVDALESYSKRVREFKMSCRNIYYDKGYIFPNTNEYPGYPNFIKTIENRMQRLLKLSGLNQSLTPHSLRHTHTSLLAEAGVPLEDIMDRLGHQDDRTTKTVYLHVTKTRKKEASKKFGELMQGL